jgi:hypothetical protein
MRGLANAAEPRRPVPNNWLFRAFRDTAEEIERARQVN